MLHPVEIAPVLEAAINVVRPTAEAKGIQIDVDFEPEPAAVPGDINRLQQVFWNLLSNAVKFTPAGGKIFVRLRHVNSEVEITVADTGQGINQDFLPYVFDRFRQADSTSTRQHGGLGLGLAIARHLVEIHGGSVSASSGGNTGCRLYGEAPIGWFYTGNGRRAPAAKLEEEAASLGRLKSRQLLSGLHVLLVDDDQDTLDLLSAALTSEARR